MLQSDNNIDERGRREVVETKMKGILLDDGGCETNDDEENGQLCDDFDVLLSTVSALIVTNDEIWHRCKPYCKKKNDYTILVYRIGYFTVDSVVVVQGGRKGNSDGDDADDADDDEDKKKKEEEISFGTTLEVNVEELRHFPTPYGYGYGNGYYNSKNIKALLCLPKELTELGGLVDAAANKAGKDDDDSSILSCCYEAYFNAITTTFEKKPIASQYLLILKKHLEDVQVALGTIETWIVEPMYSLDFINKQFGTNLAIPDLKDMLVEHTVRRNPCDEGMNHPPCQKRWDESICLICFEPNRRHRVKVDDWGKYVYDACPVYGLDPVPPSGRFYCQDVTENLITLPLPASLTTKNNNKKFNVALATSQTQLKQFMRKVKRRNKI